MHDARPAGSVLAAHLEDEAVLLEMDRRRYFRLNDTGQTIWRALESGQTPAGAARLLVERYAVEPDQAAAAVDEFIAELEAYRLVERAAGT